MKTSLNPLPSTPTSSVSFPLPPNPGYPTSDDVERLRNEVVARHPESKQLFATLWTSQYLRLVMTRPSKGDKKKMRSFEYSVSKLCKAFESRRECGVDDIYPISADKVNLPEDVKDVCKCGSLYWRGVDRDGAPVLWVRNNRKDWNNIDVDTQRRLHVWLIEWGMHHMPKGQCQFTIAADTSNMTLTQLTAMTYTRMLISIFMTLYPDRVKQLLVGPISMLLRKLYSLCTPLLPRNVRKKIKLLPKDVKSAMKDFLEAKQIPIFFGGEASHKDYFDFKKRTKPSKRLERSRTEVVLSEKRPMFHETTKTLNNNKPDKKSSLTEKGMDGGANEDGFAHQNEVKTENERGRISRIWSMLPSFRRGQKKQKEGIAEHDQKNQDGAADDDSYEEIFSIENMNEYQRKYL